MECNKHIQNWTPAQKKTERILGLHLRWISGLPTVRKRLRQSCRWPGLVLTCPSLGLNCKDWESRIFFYVSGYWRTEAIHTNTNQRAGVVLVISDNKDFKSITVIEDKGQYILIRGSLHQEDITIRSMYKPNNRAPKHTGQILIGLKGKSGGFTLINGSFNTSLSVMDRTFRQKVI